MSGDLTGLCLYMNTLLCNLTRLPIYKDWVPTTSDRGTELFIFIGYGCLLKTSLFGPPFYDPTKSILGSQNNCQLSFVTYNVITRHVSIPETDSWNKSFTWHETT